jgi:hypothetical protein
LPEGSPLGVENVWQIRLVGDTQVFQKDEGVSVYGAVTLRNLYWPGWVTVANVIFCLSRKAVLLTITLVLV